MFFNPPRHLSDFRHIGILIARTGKGFMQVKSGQSNHDFTMVKQENLIQQS